MKSFCHVAMTVYRASVLYFGILVVVVFLNIFTVLIPFFSIPEACVVKYYLDSLQIQVTFFFLSHLCI